MRSLSIDPGLRHLGWSVMEGPRVLDLGALTLPKAYSRTCLHDCVTWYLQQPDLAQWLNPGRVQEVCLERMVVYPKEAEKANDLLDCQAIGAALAGRAHAPLAWLEPSLWKGQVPKSVQHAAMRRWITSQGDGAEFERLLRAIRADDREHALDAHGIHLFHLGLCGPEVNRAQWDRLLKAALTSFPSREPARALARVGGVSAPVPSDGLPAWARPKAKRTRTAKKP